MKQPETGCLQLTESGKLRHLLTLGGLGRNFISNLVDWPTIGYHPADQQCPGNSDGGSVRGI